MALLDAPFRSLAKALISTFGADATLTRSVPGTYDPVSGTQGTPTETTYSVRVSPPEGYSKDLIDSNVVLRDDFKTYLAAKDLAVVPTPSTDSLTLNSRVYRIVRSSLIYSGAEVALYELQLRV